MGLARDPVQREPRLFRPLPNFPRDCVKAAAGQRKRPKAGQLPKPFGVSFKPLAIVQPEVLLQTPPTVPTTRSWQRSFGQERGGPGSFFTPQTVFGIGLRWNRKNSRWGSAAQGRAASQAKAANLPLKAPQQIAPLQGMSKKNPHKPPLGAMCTVATPPARRTLRTNNKPVVCFIKQKTALLALFSAFLRPG